MARKTITLDLHHRANAEVLAGRCTLALAHGSDGRTYLYSTATKLFFVSFPDDASAMAWRKFQLTAPVPAFADGEAWDRRERYFVQLGGKLNAQ